MKQKLAFLGILAFMLLPDYNALADLTVAYSGSSDQAIIVSFFNRQTEGNNLVGTLQIQNISGTWVYIEQDLTSSPNPVNMPYTIYLLGPGDIKTFPNFTFPQGSYFMLTTTTPLGLDFTHPTEKLTALEGAFAVDLSTRGLLTFSLPSDAFDQPPIGEVVSPLLDTFVSTVSPIGELGEAIQDKSITETSAALADMVADNEDMLNGLTALLKNDVTQDQIKNSLGFFAEFIDLTEKVSLITDLTAQTFDAPPITWSRMDIVSRTQTPNISSVSPNTLTTMPVPQTQLLTIHGSGFTSSSSLVFTIGSATYPSRADRLQFIDANTLQYNIAVGSAVGTWSVSLADGTGSATFQVNAASSGLYTITPINGPHGSISPNGALTKAGGESQTFIATPQDSTYTVDSWYVDGSAVPTTGNLFTLADIQTSHTVYVTFKPVTTNAQTGSLVVNLSPSNIGGQWQVNGTYYNSGDLDNPLTPGQYTVSFKPVSGYSTPASFSVNIVASAQITTNATYTAVAATTYTLTLNSASGQGSITPSPIGSGGGNSFTYNSGSLVQLTANAAPGYHFTNWSGDASGTANQTTVTMNSAKNVTANFASGDPGLATISVTLLPQAAVTAGAQWKFNGFGWTNTGASYTTSLLGANQNYLQFQNVSGYITPSPFYVTVSGGNTTNITVTYQQDTTPGLLTVALSPPDAVNAGVHWHVNGGTYGNGTPVSLAPGNYTVTFDSVSGWTAPTDQSVTMQPSQTINIAGNYTPPAGQPVIGSISPPIGAMTGGTLMTISGANFTAPATVMIGEQAASNVSVSGSTQITCSTPASTNYGSASVIIQTASGSATNLNGFAYGFANGNKISLVGSIGGSCLGAAVQGNYAYVGEGRSLLVLNISTPSNPLKVGQVTLPGSVRGVALLNQYAYVADQEGGLQVVDISSPTTPKIAGFYSTTNQVSSVAISIYGGRAYVADEDAGLQIFNLSNPTQPVLLSSTNIGGGEAIVIKASVNGVFAYVSTGGSLCIVDVSNPLSPVLRGRTSINGGSVYSIALAENYVYAAALYGNLEIIDVSNTNAPADVGQAPSILYPSAIASAGGYIYAASLFGQSSLYIFSPNGSNLTLIGKTASTTPSGGYSLLVSGTDAYVAGGAGFEIVDVSNPYSPALSTVFTDSGVMQSYYSVAVTENSLAALGNGFNSVFNVSNPSAPILAANPNINALAALSPILANNQLVYILDNNSNFIFNVSTPSAPSLVKLFANTASRGWNMALAGNMLYVVGDVAEYVAQGNQVFDPHFAAIDVSIPSAPMVRGTKDLTDFGSGIATAVAVSGAKALVGIQTYTTPVQNVLIALDISNIGSPIEQDTFTNLPSQPIDIQMSSDGSAGYVLTTGYLYVLNTSQAASLTMATNIPLDSSTAHDLKIRGNELYVATTTELYVFDVSSPMSPVLTRSYSMLGIWGISVPTDSAGQSGNIYVADSSEGIGVLQEQDDQAPDVYITDPIFGGTWTTTTSSTELGGGSADNVGVTAITWSNNRGGSGQVSPPLDNWYITGIPLYPGTNILTVTAYDAAGNTGTDFLTVIYQTSKQNQAITFESITNHTFGDAPIPLVAAASSGLSVIFSVISGPAELTSSNTLILTGASVVTVEATQSGNDLFNPASPQDVSFNVARANQAITFAPLPDKSAGDAPFALTATTSSGLPVYFDVLSGPAILDASNNVTLLGAGSVSVLAWQPGNSNYNAAATVQQSFNVSKIPQTITFGALSPQKVGDAPFPLDATASSGLLVNYSVYGPAALSGNIITLNGYGTVTVTASQPGNNSYAAAANVPQSFAVSPPDDTLIGLGFQNGSFQMAFYGLIGSNYVFNASSNLLNWQPFTNFIPTDSPQYFSDPSATNHNQRFYRPVLP